MKTQKKDHELMSLLKLSEISRIICDTNMGTLKLRLRKGETDYRFVLDAVELPKDLNKEVMELLYPIISVPQPKLSRESEIVIAKEISKEILENLPQDAYNKVIKPKGRPVGSKNKIVINKK